MTLLRRLAHRCRVAVAAVALACSVSPALAVDWNDLFWNPAESGWGVNFVQNGNFIFATFFVYDEGLQPTWYSGQMTIDAIGIWSGPLYATTGSFYGAPWNPGQRTTTAVGIVTFAPSSSTGGTLTYNVNNVNVSKQVIRQTLQTIAIGGDYFGGIVADVYNCTNPLLNQVVRLYSQFAVVQTAGGQLQFDFSLTDGGTCRMVGNFVQDGTLLRIPSASYTCSTGLTTTAVVSQIKATNNGIEGQWIANVNAGCTEAGYFSAILF